MSGSRFGRNFRGSFARWLSSGLWSALCLYFMGVSLLFETGMSWLLSSLSSLSDFFEGPLGLKAVSYLDFFLIKMYFSRTFSEFCSVL
jgi:hypothetical protein